MKLPNFLLKILSKILSKKSSDYLGTACHVNLNDLELREDDTVTKVKVNVELSMLSSDIPKLLTKLGIM